MLGALEWCSEPKGARLYPTQIKRAAGDPALSSLLPGDGGAAEHIGQGLCFQLGIHPKRHFRAAVPAKCSVLFRLVGSRFPAMPQLRAARWAGNRLAAHWWPSGPACGVCWVDFSSSLHLIYMDIHFARFSMSIQSPVISQYLIF